MRISRIVIVVALQKYVSETPLALLMREIGSTLARAHGASIDVVTVEAPVHQLPSAESLETKLEIYAAPLTADGHQVKTYLLQGRPSDVLPAFLATHEASLVLAGTHSKRRTLELPLGNTAKALTSSLPAARLLLVRPSDDDVARAQDLTIPGAPLAFIYV
jgi:nucleotide-binding universal stress UspA family protein